MEDEDCIILSHFSRDRRTKEKRRSVEMEDEEKERRLKKRHSHIILDSDESDDEDRPQSPRPRTSQRRRIYVASEDEASDSNGEATDNENLVTISASNSEDESTEPGSCSDSAQDSSADSGEDSGEDSTEDSSADLSAEEDAPKLDPIIGLLPPISIHRIPALHFLDTSTKKSGSSSSLEENVEERTIDSIILRNKEKSSLRSYDASPYLLKNFKAIPCPLKPEFQSRLYVQQTRHSHPLLKFYDCKEENRTVNIVWFLYRPGDIFALTTEHGRQVVREFADQSFAQNVAARLGTEEGPKRRVEKVLAGNTDIVAKLVKKAQQTGNASDPPLLCTNFTAALKPTASILKLAPFRGATGIPLQTKPSITFGSGSLRIEKKMKIEHFPLILDHLSTIQHGQLTYHFIFKSPQEGDDQESDMEDDVPEIEESDSMVYKRDFSRIWDEREAELNKALLELIQKELKKRVARVRTRNPSPPTSSHVANFDFSYMYHEQDFLKLDPQQVLNGRWNMVYNTRHMFLPLNTTLDHVLNVLAKNSEGSFMEVDGAKLDRFSKQIKNMKLKGSFSGGGRVGSKGLHNLYNCIEGELIHPATGDLFWRVQNIWCFVDPDFYITVNQWFIKFLNDNFVPGVADHHLTLPWTPVDDSEMEKEQDLHAEALQEYLNSYISLTPRAGFYFRFQNTYGPFCDLVYMDPEREEIVLYFLCTSFVTQTKSVCQRMHECRQRILKVAEYGKTKSKSRNGTIRVGHEYLKGLYNQLQQFWPNKFGPVESYDWFVKCLGKSTLMYTLVKEQDKSLAQERETKMQVTREELQELLGDDEDEVGSDIMKELESHHYIQKGGQVTPKLVYSTLKGFTLPMWSDPGQRVMKERLFDLLGKFKPKFKSLGARLELRELANVSTLSQTEIDVKICEIEVSRTSNSSPTKSQRTPQVKLEATKRGSR